MWTWTVSGFFVVFFNDTATTEIYTLSLHDAIPILTSCCSTSARDSSPVTWGRRTPPTAPTRSEEHTSELQSRQYLVCRLLLEKKKHDHEALDIAQIRIEPV